MANILLPLRRNLSGLDRRVYILSGGWLINSAGFAMVIPFLSIYFHDRLGLSMTAIGVFFGYTALLRAIPQPIAGSVSDHIGRVPIMGWSQILRAFTFVGVGYAIMKNSGFWVIAAIISINFIVGAVLQPAAHAMVADVTKREERMSGFSMLRIAGNLGWAIGPAMGGFLAHYSYSSLFFFSAFLNLVSGIYFLVTLRDLPRSERTSDAGFRFRDLLNWDRDKLIHQHCAISFLVFLVMAQLIAALSVYTVDTVGISQAELGTLYTLNGLMVVVLQIPTSILFRKFRLSIQLVMGSVVYAIGYTSVGFAAGYAALFICMIIITMGEIITIPPALTLVTNLSPPGAYGRNMGIFGFFQTGGWSFGPTVGGVLLDLFPTRPAITWGIIGVIAMTAAGLYLLFGRRLSLALNTESEPMEAPVAHVPS